LENKEISMTEKYMQIVKKSEQMIRELKELGLKRLNESGLEKIMYLAKSGTPLHVIAENLGCCNSTVSHLIKESFGKTYMTLLKESFKEKIFGALNGEYYLFEVRKLFNSAASTFYFDVAELNRKEKGILDVFKKEKLLTESAKIRLKESLKDGCNSRIDTLIEKGFSQEYIAGKVRCTLQYIGIYIRGSCQYQFWKEKREEKIRRELEEK